MPPGVFQACRAGADADVFRVWNTVELSLMYEPDALLKTPGTSECVGSLDSSVHVNFVILFVHWQSDALQ